MYQEEGVHFMEGEETRGDPELLDLTCLTRNIEPIQLIRAYK